MITPINQMKPSDEPPSAEITKLPQPEARQVDEQEIVVRAKADPQLFDRLIQRRLELGKELEEASREFSASVGRTTTLSKQARELRSEAIIGLTDIGDDLENTETAQRDEYTRQDELEDRRSDLTRAIERLDVDIADLRTVAEAAQREVVKKVVSAELEGAIEAVGEAVATYQVLASMSSTRPPAQIDPLPPGVRNNLAHYRDQARALLATEYDLAGALKDG